MLSEGTENANLVESKQSDDSRNLGFHSRHWRGVCCSGQRLFFPSPANLSYSAPSPAICSCPDPVFSPLVVLHTSPILLPSQSQSPLLRRLIPVLVSLSSKSKSHTLNSASPCLSSPVPVSLPCYFQFPSQPPSSFSPVSLPMQSQDPQYPHPICFSTLASSTTSHRLLLPQTPWPN